MGLQGKEIGCYQVPCAGFPNPLCGGGKMDRLSCFTKLGMNITICTIPLQPITVGFSPSPSYAAYNSGVQPVSFPCSLLQCYIPLFKSNSRPIISHLHYIPPTST